MLSQMQELVRRVQEKLVEPWHKKVGRPKSCGLHQAVEIACMYLRHNGTQEFLGDLRNISQPTVKIIQNPHEIEKKNSPRAASNASR